MRPLAAALAGSGVALGMSLVIWPLYVLGANLAVVRGVNLPGPIIEVLLGLPLGAIVGVGAIAAAGIASQRALPFSAFASWLIWAFVLALMLVLGAVPLVFVTAATGVGLATTALVVGRVRPRLAPAFARALLGGFGGFSVFVIVLVLAIGSAARLRPGGVGPAEWRRYMDGVDILGFIAVGIGLSATLALAAALAERRLAGVLLSLPAFGVLFLASAPLLGFLSACYAGEVLRIFGWLVSPSC